jgi:protein-S-isoprenylcysteine O-methyltransferase Ste14
MGPFYVRVIWYNKAMQNIPALIVLASWIVFCVVWVISAAFSKPYVTRGGYASWYMRIVFILVFVLFLNLPGSRQTFPPFFSVSLGPTVAWIGAALTVLGVSLAIWARAHLGTNWGMPVSLKKDAELITTGPYAYIRNPIYTGMLLTMLGSSLAVSLWWLVALVLFGGYFIYACKVEEKIMGKEFPNTYPAYKARTKMLIPFVL